MYITSRFERDAKLMEHLARGGGVADVVGIAGQSDTVPPHDSDYRLSPRFPEDIVFAPRPPYRIIAAATVVGLLATLLVYSWFRRRGAERRAARLQRLSEELRRSEQALRESEEVNRLTFEQVAVGLGHLSIDGRWLKVNRRLCEVLGYPEDELLRLTAREVVHPEDYEARPELHEALWDGTIPSYSLERRYLRKDGSVVWTTMTAAIMRDANGLQRHILVALEDVTQRKQLEQRLRGSERIEAVGRLAGGVAHDFNNLLTAIKGYCHLALGELHPGTPARDDIAEIERAADRASALTRQLLAFSRQQVLQPRVLDLNDTVRGMEKMLGRMVMSDVVLETRLTQNLGRIEADPSQLEQVLMNLVVNARDAMPAGGQLTISTANVEVREDSHPDGGPAVFPAGSYVMLAVSDTGEGMTRETRERIFEPFFTTKEQGKGTGLGLSTVYGIVKQSGGYIWVHSEPGQGTTFKVYLPRVRSAGAVEVHAPRAVPSCGGAERILVVDDEASVRAVAQRILQRAGYDVLVAANGAEGIELLAATMREDGGIALVLTDLIMPEMRGTELLRRLRERHGEVRAVLMSGYTADAATRQRIIDGGTAFLEKPFTSETLLRIVRETLDATAAAA